MSYQGYCKFCNEVINTNVQGNEIGNHECNAYLIGCEESQAITMAMRERGLNAFSCDLKPCSGGHHEWHLQMDIFEAIELTNWKFIGLHPVCTKMTLSGNRTYGKNKPRHNERI